MAKTFSVSKISVADNSSDVAGAIKTSLDALGIGNDNTVYSITVTHLRGFFEVITVYEP